MCEVLHSVWWMTSAFHSVTFTFGLIPKVNEVGWSLKVQKKGVLTKTMDNLLCVQQLNSYIALCLVHEGSPICCQMYDDRCCDHGMGKLCLNEGNQKENTVECSLLQLILLPFQTISISLPKFPFCIKLQQYYLFCFNMSSPIFKVSKSQ